MIRYDCQRRIVFIFFYFEAYGVCELLSAGKSTHSILVVFSAMVAQ